MNHHRQPEIKRMKKRETGWRLKSVWQFVHPNRFKSDHHYRVTNEKQNYKIRTSIVLSTRMMRAHIFTVARYSQYKFSKCILISLTWCTFIIWILKLKPDIHTAPGKELPTCAFGQNQTLLRLTTYHFLSRIFLFCCPFPPSPIHYSELRGWAKFRTDRNS